MVRILASLPLSAMFVLFDMVIQKPTHPETQTNLALLDTVAGYFSRFDYATGGSIPSSLFSGFAHIANQFVRDQWQNTTTAEEPEMQNTTQRSQDIDLASRCRYLADSFVWFSSIKKTLLDTTLTPMSSCINRPCITRKRSIVAGIPICK